MDNSTGKAPANEQEEPLSQPYQPYMGGAQPDGVTRVAQTSGDGYEVPPTVASDAGMSPRRRAVAIGIGVLSLLLIAVAFVVEGEPARFVTVGLQFVPLAILAALAYSALRSTTAALFTHVWLAILMLLLPMSLLIGPVQKNRTEGSNNGDRCGHSEGSAVGAPK